MAISEITAYRLKLWRAGFSPIPIVGKRPPMKEWDAKIDTNDGEIELWEKLYPFARSTGIFTKTMPTIDVDIIDPFAAEAVENLAREQFSDSGVFLVRFGQLPKRAVPLRTSESFGKISVNLTGPTGVEHKIEILASGQQVVCHGIHVDTGEPYRWHGGEPGDVQWSQLPLITRQGAEQFIIDAGALLVRDFDFKANYHGKNRGKTNGATDGRHHDAEWARLLENIRLGRDLHDSIRDLAARLVASGMGDGAAVNFLRGLMNNATCAHDARWQERYGDTPRAVASARAKFAATKGTDDGAILDDFYAHMPTHRYLYRPARDVWPASSVNARITPVPLVDKDGQPVLNKQREQVNQSASAWLDTNRAVEQMTWAPGLPELIRNRLISEAGWIEHTGAAVYNLYRPPTLLLGNAADAGQWLDLVRKVFPEEADHIIAWFAHRVQRPAEKINHALILGGNQGIGKDTLIEPVRRAVGPWNFSDISPQQLLGRFNAFVKSVILRLNEARDLGDYDRYLLYEHIKPFTAAPPDTLRVDEKNLREYNVVNCVGVVITTNNRTDGIYLPADDRRHFVAWSPLSKDDFSPDYWRRLWKWYDNGGFGHVGAYLSKRDLSGFDPKTPPPKTPAFWAIVDANRSPEEAEFADLLDDLDNPPALTLGQIQGRAEGDFGDWIKDRKNRRTIPHRMERCGYVPVRNPDAEDGLWKVGRKRQAIYASASLNLADRMRAARDLINT